MTRRDYKAIADAVKTSTQNVDADGIENVRVLRVIPPGELAEKLASIMAADNPRFDRVKFLAACGL